MEITKVYFKDYNGNGALVAFADIEFDGEMIVNGFSVYQKDGRTWADTPSKKDAKGEWHNNWLIRWSDKEWYKKDANPILNKIAEEYKKRTGNSTPDTNPKEPAGMEEAW